MGLSRQAGLHSGRLAQGQPRARLLPWRRHPRHRGSRADWPAGAVAGDGSGLAITTTKNSQKQLRLLLPIQNLACQHRLPACPLSQLHPSPTPPAHLPQLWLASLRAPSALFAGEPNNQPSILLFLPLPLSRLASLDSSSPAPPHLTSVHTVPASQTSCPRTTLSSAQISCPRPEQRLPRPSSPPAPRPYDAMAPSARHPTNLGQIIEYIPGTLENMEHPLRAQSHHPPWRCVWCGRCFAVLGRNVGRGAPLASKQWGIAWLSFPASDSPPLPSRR